MQNLETRATKRYNERRRSTARRYGIGLLALLVLLCTAVALLLPAFTLEKDVFCGLEEHTHTEACYELVPVCAVEEHAAHTHTDACFETVRELSCGLEESEGHTHTDACFAVEKELTCGIAEDAGHTHTEACYIEEREPVCGIVEDAGHIHDESCWVTERELVCALEENEEHQHDDACYIENPLLVCGEEQREGHVHDDSCYETYRVPNCGEEEREGHTHTDECYTEKQKLVCELPEDEGHTHSDACYAEKQKLVCELPEDEGHTHSEACFEKKLICEKEEHTHSLQCYSNPEAVESEAEWLLSFPAFTEDTPRLERLLGIAVSQIGYQESAANYLVDENESLHGYTRFGDFCGEPYADWNAMFVSFCLHYADIDAEFFPAEGDAQGMIDALTEKELYIPNGTEGFLPRPGDLVFFDNLYTGTYDVRVGIVTSVDAESGVLTVIEGDIADRVNESKYAPDDTTILGYGVLPEELRAEAAAEADTKDTDAAEKTDTAEKTDAAEKTDTDTKAADTDELQTKGLLRLPGQANLLGDGSQTISLVELTNSIGGYVRPTVENYSNLERGAEMDLEFEYLIQTDKIQDAILHDDWVYNLNSGDVALVGDEAVFSRLNSVQNGELKDEKGNTVGTYDITENGEFHINPNKDYLENVTEPLKGKFALKAILNEDYSLGQNDKTIEFPGKGTAKFHYKYKNVTRNKKVATSDGGADEDGKEGVQLVQEADGKYYLYYTITTSTQGDALTHLNVIDELEGGQKLIPESIVIESNGQNFAYGNSGSYLKVEENNSGFNLDVAGLYGGKIDAWRQFTIKYKTEVDQTTVESGNIGELKNTAGFHWESDGVIETTKVTPKFDKTLEHSKTVGGKTAPYTKTSGNVEVVKEDGEYYLYYKLTAKPNAKTDSIHLTDTIGEGQTVTGNIEVKVDGQDAAHTLSVSDDGRRISGDITPAGGIPANKEVVVTYKVKLDQNEDGTPKLTDKTNHAEWQWDEKPWEDETKVKPEVPDPAFGVNKTAPSGVKPGEGIEYTVTIHNVEVEPDVYADLHNYTFHDYISNYPFAFNGPVTVKDNENNEVSGGSIVRPDKPDGAQPGESFELFNYTFPEGSTAPYYTITYTVTPDADENGEITGILKYINRGVIGKGEQTTTTDVDYGTPSVSKSFARWDKENNNAAIWTIHVEIPEERTYKEVIVTEKEFNAGKDQYNLTRQMTIDWNSLTVLYTDGTAVAPALYRHVDGTNTIIFSSLNKSCDITVRTVLPDNLTLSNVEQQSEDFMVHNKVGLKVNDKDLTDGEDWHQFERTEYSFDKKGKFDGNGEGTPTATWTVVINKKGGALSPNPAPIFYDAIPEGMEFVPGSFNVSVKGYGNRNRAGNAIGEFNCAVSCPYTASDIGSVNLVEALAEVKGEANVPDGLSGTTFTVTYQTRITAETWQTMEGKIDNYTFTNEARILDEGGDTVKADSETIKYEYDNVVKKVSVDGEIEGNELRSIKYRIGVNPNAIQLLDEPNGRIELFDKLDTDITLKTDTVKVYQGTLGTDDAITGTQVYPKQNPEYPDPGITVSYDDNSRLLRLYVPDAKAFVVEFEVGTTITVSHLYKNTAYLTAGDLNFKSYTEKEYKVGSYATVETQKGSFSICKRDLYAPNTFVKGAQFELYEAELDENKKIVKRTLIRDVQNNRDYFESDEKGMVVFNRAFEPNKLYYWKEIYAPEPYWVADTTEHNFCVYKEYSLKELKETTENELLNKTMTLSDFGWELASKIKTALGNQNMWQVTLAQLKEITDSQLKEDALKKAAEILNKQNLYEADRFDNAVELANNIIVMHAKEDHIWNWNNPQKTAYVSLKGRKFLHGDVLQKDEFAFMLYEILGDQRIRVQLLTNGEDGKFNFADIAYSIPDVYHYEIVEYTDKTSSEDYIPDPSIHYDDISTVRVDVTVTQEDLEEKREIPKEQIKYYKGNMELDPDTGAIFNNDKIQASIIINKAFSGNPVPSEEKKRNLSFRITDKSTNEVVKTIPYSEMTAGHYYVLTAGDGIQPGGTYLVEELLPAPEEGVVCIASYTVDSTEKKTGSSAEVTVPSDKPVQVDFENHYENKHMELTVRKRWYKQGENENEMTPLKPGTAVGVNEIYFALQRKDTEGENWQWLNSEFAAVADLASAEKYAVRAATGWLTKLGTDGRMPIGEYRVFEVEKDGENWRAVDGSDVVYVKDTELEVGTSQTIDRTYLGTVDGTENSKGTVYIYNKSYELDFVKKWKDKGNNEVADPFDKYDIKSITFKLMQSTDPNDENPTFTGKKVTITSAEDKIHFEGLAQKNENGEDVYYSVKEEITFNDGTVDGTAERFKIEPATGVQPSDKTQTITNVEQVFGITVTKNWQLTDENPETVYVQMQAYYNNGFHPVNDFSIKTDDNVEPIKINDNLYLYKIQYDDTKHKSITFSSLFREPYQVEPNNPHYLVEVSKVKFVEYRYVHGTYTEFSDYSHLVTYSFEGKNGTQDALNGISKYENGTLTITNTKRASTKLSVTKSWPGNETNEKIRFKVYAVLDDGTTQIISKGMQGVTATDDNWEGNDRLVLTATSKVENIWPTTSFDISAQLTVNGQQRYVSGVYIVEVGEDGNPLDANGDGMTDLQTENWKITYTFDGKTVSPTKPVPAGSNGTLTITNAKPTPPSVDLKIVKVDANDLNKELADVTTKLVATFKLSYSKDPVAETSGSYEVMDAYKENPVPTNTNGELTFENLLDGYYRLVEVNAPQDYVNSSEPFDFTVKDGILTAPDSRLIKYVTVGDRSGGGKVYTYKIGNEKGVELPSTGGVGVGAYRIGGAALLLASAGLAAAEPLKRSRADRARRRKGG